MRLFGVLAKRINRNDRPFFNGVEVFDMGAGDAPWRFEAFRLAAPTSEFSRRVTSEALTGQATIVAGTRPTFLARLVDTNGSLVSPAEVESVSYTIGERKVGDPAWQKVIDGQTEKALVVADVVLGSVLTDYPWGTLDTTGYNVKFEMDAEESEPFAKSLRLYVVKVVFQPTDDRSPVPLVFSLNTL